MITDKILIDLDALLDRRIAAINVTYPNVAQYLMETPGYFNRYNDDFKGLRPELINFNYKGVDIDKVKEAVFPTNVITTLTTHSVNCRAVTSLGALEQEMELFVNCSGWNMSSVEILEMEKALREAIGTDKVTVLDMEKDYNSPTNLKENYMMYITYDLNGWMTDFATDLKCNPIPGVRLVAPYIVINESQTTLQHAEIVEATQVSMVSYFTLTLLPLEDFSLMKLS